MAALRVRRKSQERYPSEIPASCPFGSQLFALCYHLLFSGRNCRAEDS